MNSEREKSILRKNDATFVFSVINKEINFLNDALANKKERRDAIEKLYKFIVLDEPQIQSILIQEILISFNKNFLKFALFDQLDKCREFSLKILIQ
jgi:hypothetical protein